MNEILREIRVEYEQIQVKNRDEAEEWYKVCYFRFMALPVNDILRKNVLNLKKSQRIIHLNLKRFKWKFKIIENKSVNSKWNLNHFEEQMIISKEILQVMSHRMSHTCSNES